MNFKRLNVLGPDVKRRLSKSAKEDRLGMEPKVEGRVRGGART